MAAVRNTGRSGARKAARQAASGVAKKAAAEVTKKVAETATNAAVKGAASAAAGAMSGGASLALQAGLFAASKAKDIAVGAGGLIIAAMSGGINVVTSAAWSSFAIAISAGLAIVAFFLVIINTGAYIVPPSGGSLVGLEDRERIECLVFSGPWSDSALATELQAAEKIFQSPTYTSNLCADGDITVEFVSTQAIHQGLAYGGRAYSAESRIEIYQAGTGSLGNTLYTLSHELGHLYDYRNGPRGYYRAIPSHTVTATNVFIYNPNSERPICTYPFFGNIVSLINSRSGGLTDDEILQIKSSLVSPENFAELIALYIAGPNPESGYRDLGCLGGNFRNSLPTTWEFAKNNIFGGYTYDW